MSRPGMGSHERTRCGETDEWLTPPAILDVLGPFDLDPCAPVVRPWDMATHHYTLIDDGLVQPWHGFVWLNPPYGAQTWTWLDRLADHGTGIALTFARTETVGFVRSVWGRASAVLFLHGRLRFHRLDGTQSVVNAGAPSCLIAYGDEACGRLEAAPLRGSYVTSWRECVSSPASFVQGELW